MSIRMVIDMHSPDKAVVPEVVCDQCGGTITDGKRALVLYPVWFTGPQSPREFGAVAYVHDRCSDVYQQEQSERLKAEDWYAEDLQTWLPRVGFAVLPVRDRAAILETLDRLYR